MTTMMQRAGMAAAMIGAGGLVGCSSTNWPPKYHETRTMVLTAPGHEVSIDADAPFGALHAAAHGHDAPRWKDLRASLPEAGAGEVAVVAIIRSDREERLADAVLSPTWHGDTLELDVEWPKGKKRKNEGADWIVRAPAIGSVWGNYDFGDVTIIDAQGNIDLSSDFGDVVLIEPLGWVDIDADFGDVSIERAHRKVTIECDFGDVDVTLTDENPGPVDINADFGDVTLTAGPAFTGILGLDTDFGRSRLSHEGSDTKSMSTNGTLTTRLGDGPHSSLSADFGSVNVTIRE
ncbi:MAG: hypothetical protein DHS20C14_18200 [Phycisphaeraceae bacterium]|nr:MAG: hypothetical protein DHS20C14_18200 [Phycisphaeraceae bacterium]